MALLFTILCGATAIILGYFSYYFYRGHYVLQTEAVIDTELRHVSITEDLNSVLPVLESGDRLYLHLSKEDQIINGNLNAIPKADSVLSEGIILFTHKDKQYAAKIKTLQNGNRFLVGVDMSDVQSSYSFMQLLSLISIVLIFLVVLTSYVISQFVVRGTNKIATAARDIMDTGNLSRRVDVFSRWDDLGHMTVVLNECFERIEYLMDGISHVSDNIAHDLRTPLTRLRGHLEDLQKRAQSSGDEVYAKESEKLISEADHLLDTFNALLRIARIEAGKQKTSFQETDLLQVVHDALELYEPLAEEKNISVEQNLVNASLNADRDLIFQLVTNIVDNAVKFTPESGSVSVSMFKKDDSVELIIQDNGIGVPDKDKEKIFNRFYRSDKSRNTKGTGLGLSLVKAIVGLHQGEMGLSDAEPGLIITVELPL